MKRFLIGFLILSAAVFCIPSVMVPIASLVSGRTAAPAYADSAAADDTAAYGVDAPYTVTLYRVGNGETLTLDFEDYIAGRRNAADQFHRGAQGAGSRRTQLHTQQALLLLRERPGRTSRCAAV